MRRAARVAVAFAAALPLLCSMSLRALAQSASPAPESTTLPEIGRVRATPAACTVLREVAVPAVVAVQRADAKFGEMRTTLLPNFATVRDEYFAQRNVPVRSDGIFLEAQFAHLSDNLTSQLQQIDAMRKLLADPRLAGTGDAAITAQREVLEAVYEAQQQRARELFTFVELQGKVMGRQMVGWEVPEAIAAMNAPHTPEQAAAARNPFRHGVRPDMPLFTGFPLEDKERLRRWTTALANGVAVDESAAQTLLRAVASGCR